jgi:hypothetical protein
MTARPKMNFEVGPALVAEPSRSVHDNRDGLPASGSPTGRRDPLKNLQLIHP